MSSKTPRHDTVTIPTHGKIGHAISMLIEEGDIIEAYLEVCDGAECDPIDREFLRNAVDGMDNITYHNFRSALIKTGNFER